MSLVNGLVRPTEGRIVAGVCAGIARSLKVDAGLVRAVLLVGVLFAGLSVWVYPVLWLVMPEQGATTSGLDTLVREGRAFAADQRARRDAQHPGSPTEVFDPYVDDPRR